MKRFLITLSAILAFTWAFALQLIALDVGQGTAIALIAPTGHTALIDAGPSNGNATAQLRALGVEHLNVIIATHQDADHIGGMPNVIEAFPPQFYLDNGLVHTTRTYENTLLAIQDSGAQLIEPEHRNINLGDTTLTIIPPPGIPSLGQNNNSVGVLITRKAFKAFLPGDAEAEQWDWWLKRYGELLHDVNILIASHHGSRNGDTLTAVQHMNPDIVIISSGAGNTYGHPHDEALSHYQSVDAQIFRTDLHGMIRAQTEDSTGTIRLYIQRAPDN